MKARLTFALLSIAIIALLGVCAWYTMRIFDTEIAEGDFQPVKPVAPEAISMTHDETVTVPASSEKPAPPERIKPQKPAVPSAQPAAEAEPSLDHAGSIAQIAGTAYRTKPAGTRFQLSANDKIYLNDNIETEADSRVVITFIDNTQLSIGEKTRCTIDDYIFDKSRQKESSFGLRLISGTCRVVTGFITMLNPERFRVETRMATIGIRGCELAFMATTEEEKVYVLGLTSKESVEVASSDKGTALRDITTGEEDKDVQTSSVVVSEQGTLVIVSKGLGRSVRGITPAELREITTETSPLNSVKHTPRVQPKSTVFVISPEQSNGGDDAR